MDGLQILAKIIVFLLTLWALFIVATSFMGMGFYVPLRLADDGAVPEYRTYSMRVAILCTFAYYGLMHLLRPTRELHPVHTLKMLLFMMSISGVYFGYQNHVHHHEYIYSFIFLFCALILHISTKPKLKRYFGRRQS